MSLQDLAQLLVRLDAAPVVAAAEPRTLETLTRRERGVFDLAVRGYSNREIAKKMTTSVKTTETHRAKVNKKLGLSSPSDLIRFAARAGLLGAKRRASVE